MHELSQPASDVIAVNLPCAKCRRNLHGLPRAGNCPDCGTAVGKAASPKRLHFASHVWVGTLRKSFNWIAYGVFVMFGLFVVAIAGGTIYALFRASFMPSADDHEVWVVPAILIWGVMIMMPTLFFFMFPVWFFTTPEPGVEGRQIIRRGTRLLAVLAGISSLLVLPFTLAGPVVLYFVWGGISVACLWLWAGVLIGMGLYMLGLAWRAPRRKLIAETVAVVLLITAAVWGIAIALILALAGVIGNVIAIEEQEQTIAEASVYLISSMVGLSFALYLALIVLAAWVILLFRRYQVMFKQVDAEMSR
jgi:MFS family permease